MFDGKTNTDKNGEDTLVEEKRSDFLNQTIDNSSTDTPNDTEQNGEEKKIRIRSLSNSEIQKKRVIYYGAKRRVDSLEGKKDSIIKTIKSGRKERIRKDKDTDEQIVVVIKLTDAQIKDEKRKLADLVLDLEIAKDDLKEKDYGFSAASQRNIITAKSKRQAYQDKRAEQKLKSVQALVNSAVMNGCLQDVADLRELAGSDAKIKEVKSGLMKIVRKQNKNGYPISNVLNKTVEIIMAGLLNWEPDSSDQPFEIS